MIPEFLVGTLGTPAEQRAARRREPARAKTQAPAAPKPKALPYIVRGLQAEGPDGYLRELALQPKAEPELQGAQSFAEIAARLSRADL